MGLDLLALYRERFKKEWKIAFLGTFIVGMLVHIYKFMNMLPNHDSVYNYYSSQNIIGSGRWFLSIACGASSYFDLPWVIGLFSVFLIALTAIVITIVFGLTNPVQIVLCGALLAAFPGITETMFFEFTADGYMLAMLLAACGVMLTRMDCPGAVRTILGAGCICLACGIYQAYVSFGLVLALCYLMYEILKRQRKTAQILRWIVRQVVLYAAALIAYYLIWQLAMTVQHTTASSYQGIDSLSLSFSVIANAVPETAQSIGLFFLGWDVTEHGWTAYSVLNVVFIIFFAFVFIASFVLQKMWQKKAQLLILILALAATPFAACIWHFTSEEIGYRPMMLQSLCLLFILFAVLCEAFFRRIVWKNAAAALLAVLVFNYGIMANISYYYLQQEYEASYAMAQEIVSRIHALDTDADKIAVIDTDGSGVSLYASGEPVRRIIIFRDMIEENLLYDSIRAVLFINNTFDCDYESASDAEIEVLESDASVMEMGVWPASDAVQVIGDTIVIRISGEETVTGDE